MAVLVHVKHCNYLMPSLLLKGSAFKDLFHPAQGILMVQCPTNCWLAKQRGNTSTSCPEQTSTLKIL